MQTFIDPTDGKEFEDFGDGIMVATELDEDGCLEVYDKVGVGMSFTLTEEDLNKMLKRFKRGLA